MADTNQKDNKTLFNAAQVSIDSIFKQMHDIAVSKATEAKVQNSIFDESGKFHGAGSHIIAALPLKDQKISKDVALESIKTYVQWFSGPDIKDKITADELIALEDENSQTTESICLDDIYKQVVLFEAAEVEDSKAKDNAESSNISADNGKPNNEKTLDEPNEAKGYYITYTLEIEGQKGTPLSDALKGFGAGLLKGLGIQTFDWKSGAKGKEHTVGDLVDSLSKVFGKINSDELKTRFAKNAKAKYPQTEASDVQFYDQKTILQHLKGKLETKDTQKIKTANYSLCYRVPANDKTKKLINKTVVADLITQSIKGLFKKFKNAVKKDDVILVNDYNETNKDQKKVDKKLEPTDNGKPKLQTDSIDKTSQLKSILNCIFEDVSMFDTLDEDESPERKEAREKLTDLISDDKVIDALKNDDTYTDKDVESESGSKKLTTKEDLIKKLSNKASGVASLKTSYMKTLIGKLQQIKDSLSDSDASEDAEKEEDKPKSENADLVDETLSYYDKYIDLYKELKSLNMQSTKMTASPSKALQNLAKNYKFKSELAKAENGDRSIIEKALLAIDNRKDLVSISDEFEAFVTAFEKEIDSIKKSNKLSVEHTDVDFYIVPMKGLKLGNEDTDSSDSDEVAGKSTK